MRMKKNIIMLVLGVLAGSSQADLLVGFTPGNDYVPVSKANQGQITNGTFRYVPFSTSLKSPVSGYSGPGFFGGATGTVSMSAASSLGWTTIHATNAAGGHTDFINASASSTVIGSKLWAVYMFTNQSASITQFVYNVRLSGSGTVQSNLLRIVVQKDDGSFYISQERGRPSTGYITNSNPLALSWYNYDPVNSIAGIGSQATDFTLNNVKSVGMWTSTEHVSGASLNMGAGLSVFQAYGTIPEPATVGMLGLGALVTLLIRRIKT